MTRGKRVTSRSTAVRVSAPVGAAEHVTAAARDAADSVPVVRTGPTGLESVYPLLAATLDGRTALFAAAEPETARTAVDRLADGDLPADGADAVVDHDADTRTLPVPDDGPLAAGERAVLGPCGWVDPLDPSDREFVSAGGPSLSAAARIRGRGRGDGVADGRVGEAWSTARAADGDPVVVVNGHGFREVQRGDAVLLDGDPIGVLDAAAAVTEHVGATDVVVYLSEADAALSDHVRAAVDAAADRLPVVPQVVAGPDAYRAGAPTAALEAMEGADRVEPRLQPPTPAEHGLYGRPTVIHTPRTLAQVRRAVGKPDAYAEGRADPGTRLFTVTGDVAAPATVELASDGTLETVHEAVDLDGGFKAACVGGVLGGFTPSLDVAPTAQALTAADLGTNGAVEMLNETRCPLADAGERARFAAEENSGRCVPGREGTKQLAELLRDVYDGSFEPDAIRELGRVMARSSNCKTGAHAPRPAVTAVDEFEPEIRVHIDGRCPSGACQESPQP